jgi:2,4-dienoyl-CoA reductase-like NADH-dependent reductase (Old Yellow Enzyme family)
MQLSHRLAMAPMTRSRAKPDGTPGDLAPEYYAQRASMGLLITEGTQPSDDGQGYLTTPGIYTASHVEGWKRVAAAVHREGGKLFVQLMHVGRMSHPDNTPHHRQPVAPSAIAPGAKMFTVKGMQDIPEPRALSTEEVKATVGDFRHAARMAVDAGADGVEIHGANGYLVHQFLAANANRRTDAYGGSIENRARFAVEVADAIAREIGPERTGIRISPFVPSGGIAEGPETGDVYRHLVSELDKLGLAYLHLMHTGDEALAKDIRARWTNALLVLRPGRALSAVEDDLKSGLADVVPVGRWALANPDFVERYRDGAPLNEADPTTFYAGAARGYVDYPRLPVAAVAAAS